MSARTKGRTHCDHGHELTPGNLKKRSNGTYRCRPCHNDYQVRLNNTKRPALREYQRERQRFWRYGITAEQFDELLEKQGGACALCGRTEPDHKFGWQLDHDHNCCPTKARSCGKCVRGILCFRCNNTVLPIVEGPLLGRATDYLAAHNRKEVI